MSDDFIRERRDLGHREGQCRKHKRHGFDPWASGRPLLPPHGEWSFWRGGIAVPFPTRRRWVSVLWDFVGAGPHKVDSGACVLIPDGLEWGQKERDLLCFV